MYLKTLYIQGFKSFANKTKIDFNNRITGIVGPNGSGKSNISDAIMWVLGETSVKSLRGSKMEDVIFSGTDKRKPLGFAEITIVLDNSERSLPIEFNEVSVTRRMYRSLESEFYINKTKCRLKDIKELFMDTGIGKDGYSLIGQGKIESILSTKPDQRRAIFEEAAGISKFKMKKAESERKLEKTKENLIRLNDIISEIEKRKDLLYEQSKDALKYKELFNKLKIIEISLLNRDIIKKEENLNNLKNDIISLNNKVEINKNNIVTLKNDLKEVEKEILLIEDKINENQKLEIEFNKELEQKNSKIDLLQEKIIFSKNNIENNNKNIIDIKKENSELIVNKEAISAKILELEESFDNYKVKIRDFNLLLKDKEKELSVLEEDENRNNTSFIEFNKKINDLNSKINMKESILKEKKERVVSLENNFKMLEDSNEELNENIKEYLDKYNELKINASDFIEEKTINDNYLKELEKVISKEEAALNSLKNSYEEKNAKYKALKNISENYDGYSKSVKNFMNYTQRRGLFADSLIGTVADEITVSEKYEKAISVALGGSVQNLIIEKEKDAKEMIAFLTREKLGRVTFLPLDSISFTGNKIDLKSMTGYKILGFADELISYDPKFTNIFKNLLGRIIITEDFESGVKLSKRLNRSFRVVTLNGDSLNIGGSITGGSVYNNNINILSRGNELKELQEELNYLSKDYNEKLSILNEKKNKIEELKFTSLNLFNRIDENSKKLLGLENQIESLKNTKNNNQVYIDKYKSEINQIKNSIEEDYDIISKLNSQKDILSSEESQLKEKSDSSKYNLSSIKEELIALRNEYSSFNVEYAKLESEINSLKKDMVNINREFEKNQIKISDFENSNKTINEEIERFSKDLKRLKDDLIDFERKINDFRINLEEDRKLKRERSLYLNKIRENTDEYIEFVNSSEKDIDKKNFNIDKINLEIANLKEYIFNEYKVNLNEFTEFITVNSVKKARESVLNLKKSLQDLGEVNILAIEEYEQVKERLEFNNSQKSDLLGAIDEIRNILNELDTEMNVKFKESFKKISIYFNEIFIKLFNGGRAEIEINGDDPLTAGIEIKAQPPGKRFQALSLLSGGERALTAVALLFSLLKVKPAPFCILDEIDAALDDANIKKYTNYLLTLEDIQFIMITHRKPTMEIANKLYGVTMEEKGISKLISVELNN